MINAVILKRIFLDWERTQLAADFADKRRSENWKEGQINHPKFGSGLYQIRVIRVIRG